MSREMLELAAKAAGLKIDTKLQAERDAMGCGHGGLYIKGGSTGWNPLTDRADAFSLMTALGMDVDVGYIEDAEGKVCTVYVCKIVTKNGRDILCDDGQDGPAAQRDELTMLAITRCAAEVGRRMG